MGPVLHRLKRRESSPCPPKLTRVREAGRAQVMQLCVTSRMDPGEGKPAAGRAVLRPGAAVRDGSKSKRPALPWVQFPAGAAALGDPETLAPAPRPCTSETVTLESSPTQDPTCPTLRTRRHWTHSPVLT